MSRTGGGHRFAALPGTAALRSWRSASPALEHGHVSFWGALYLISHGVVKLVLVWAILRDRLWAYPWMIAFLGVFVVYQTVAMTHHLTGGLLILTLFDLLVAWLTGREYRRLRRKRRDAAAPEGSP